MFGLACDHQPQHQVGEGPVWVPGDARVYRRRLDDRTPWGGQNTEAVGQSVILASQAHRLSTRRHDCVGGGPHGLKVDISSKRPKPYVVNSHLGTQELQPLAVQDHTDIDELATVNSRHSSKDGVLE